MGFKLFGKKKQRSATTPIDAYGTVMKLRQNIENQEQRFVKFVVLALDILACLPI